MPSCPTPEPFSDRLLAWWDRHGRKDLPWQHPRSPYRVWISEVMLQQTQVPTVVGYFERWTDRFPGIAELAGADVDEVMALWSGLGYYARARNLHKAARLCMEQFEGELPSDFETLTTLPGIGPSTASAILSLAYDKPAAILDGNVKRWLARHAGIEGWPGASRTHNRLRMEAEARLPSRRAAHYSQAVMDLGALVCTRKSPACGQCPVSSDCIALARGSIGEIPAPRPPKKVPTRDMHMLVVIDASGKYLLERRPPSGIWGGLWSLPEQQRDDQPLEKLGLGQEIDGIEPTALPELEHRLTHLQLVIRPRLLTLPHHSGIKCQSVRENPDFAWFAKDELSRLGLPKPVNRILHSLETEHRS